MIRKFNLMSNLIILIKCGVGWCGSESVKQNRQTVHPSKVESALFRAFQSDSVIGSRIRPNKTKIGKNFRNNWRQENDSVPMIDQWLSAWPAEKPVSGEKKRDSGIICFCCVVLTLYPPGGLFSFCFIHDGNLRVNVRSYRCINKLSIYKYANEPYRKIVIEIYLFKHSNLIEKKTKLK